MMRRRGFTLLELLVAGAIGVLAIGLAMQAFSEISKVLATSRAKGEAQRHAADGVQKLADMFRKAHVFFYSARPLKAQAGSPSGRADQPADRAAVPNRLLTLGSAGNTLRPPGNPNDLVSYAAWRASLASKKSYRFTDAPDGNPAFRLGVAPGRRQGDPDEIFFNGPLAYFAVADFEPTVTGADKNPYALLPKSWTISLLYLAPMALLPNDANVCEPGNERDQLPPPVVAAAPKWRTAVPFELRMLVIPGVVAGPLTPPGNYVIQPPTVATGNTARYDATVHRLIAPNLVAPNVAFLDPPYDYDGNNAAARANYDPVPIPGTSATYLDPTDADNYYRFRDTAGNQVARYPSGPRVVGEGVHGNYNMLGNDPPTEAALANLIPGSQPVDKLIVPYVDPDAVSGTVCRFVNNMREPPAGNADANGDIALPSGQAYRRFVPMIGPDCGYLENRYQTTWGDTTSDTTTGAYGVLPERAYVSLSIRYRARKDTPFQYATLQQEIPLEGVASFAKIRPRR